MNASTRLVSDSKPPLQNRTHTRAGRETPGEGTLKIQHASRNIELRGPLEGRFAEILSPEAVRFLAELHRTFNSTRESLLAQRAERQARLDAGERPDFLSKTRGIREASWTVAPPPKDLQDRRVEITGPVDRKMMINALNSGARVFMADFEDALSPWWHNVLEGQVNLQDAVKGTLEFKNPDGRLYQLNSEVATLVVRPRGWHLVEKNFRVDGAPVSASLFDFGLYFFHNAKPLIEKGSGPYFYLPKLESHLEARLWNDVFAHAEESLRIRRGATKATVLIETLLAAFEMEEILYELRERSTGLNAGRWDYIFSIIKKFRAHPEFGLPDRNQITMTVPFMRAYTELLVQTCHKRGAHAMGGMAAFVPNRRDPEATRVALEKVRADKQREASDGFDGTWVAHPDLVPVAMDVFNETLRDRPNQVDRRRDDVKVTAQDLLDVRVPGATVTEAGVRNNVSVGLQYLESWLSGWGAAALYNLMEDTATAEIARSQVWQWCRDRVALQEGRVVEAGWVRTVLDEELDRIRLERGEKAFELGRFREARALFETVALGDSFVEFLTLPAYERINGQKKGMENT